METNSKEIVEAKTKMVFYFVTFLVELLTHVEIANDPVFYQTANSAGGVT
jgi:hypothetical protein